MARYVEVIDVPLSIEAAFDALADFSRTAEWDPGVVSATRTTGDPIGVGSRFRVEVDLLGRRATYGYAITDYERPRRVVLRGGDGTTRLTDEITFVPRGRGTRITYEVCCELAGLLRIADPLVGVMLTWIGGRAVEGLRRFARTLALRERAAQRARTGSRRDPFEGDGELERRSRPSEPSSKATTRPRTRRSASRIGGRSRDASQSAAATDNHEHHETKGVAS